MPLFLATPASADEVVEPVVVVVTTPGGDDSSYQVPLTTTVTFDGVQYSSVYATTNSVITFGNPDGTYWDFPRTPSISLYSMDWVVYPQNRSDEHLIIRASDGGFQVDISARPIWLQNPSVEVTNINIVAAINTDGTVSISYSLTGPSYEGQTRTGVRLTDGSVVTLEQYGVVQVEQPPVLEPEPVAPTPTPTPESTDAPVDPTPTPTPEPTVDPTPTPTPEPTVEPTPTPTPEPTPTVTPPFVPQGATLLSEGSTIEVVAPAGQRIVSIMAWYGDPDDSTRGIDVSSTLTQLASGQTSVTIESSNMYGDPAGGTVKVLIFLPTYEPIPEPTPTPTPTPEPPVVVPPVVEPTPTPQPTPTPTPTETPVIIEPVPQPTEEPVVPTPEPTVEPTVPPTEEPTPTPTPSEEPTKEPAPEVVDETPAPEPSQTPEPTPEPELPITEVPETEAEAEKAVETLSEIAPEELTEEQAVILLAAAELVLESAIEGSAEYEAALDALAVVAQADDPELPAELAAISGAEQVLEAFNAIGNMGADMSPATREEAEKVVVAGVVAVNAALSASLVINAGTPPVAPAPSAPSGGTSGGTSSSGSGSAARRKE